MMTLSIEIQDLDFRLVERTGQHFIQPPLAVIASPEDAQAGQWPQLSGFITCFRGIVLVTYVRNKLSTFWSQLLDWQLKVCLSRTVDPHLISIQL